MSTRYKGSVMSSTQATSTAFSASGIWKQTEVAQLLNSWPNANVDQYWANVSMLLHGDGTSGAQNNTFLDSSGNALTITRNGSATQGTFSPFASTAPYSASVNGSSGYFNGTTDYLTITANAVLSFGTGDFTIECWVYNTSQPNIEQIVDLYTNNSGSFIVGQCQLAVQSNGSLYFAYATTASAFGIITTAASVVPLNTWTHIAVVRSGSSAGNLKIYVNGTASISSAGAVTQNIGTTGTATIGRQTSNGSNPYFGYISNVRIVKGTAVYTSTFTPPTAPLTAISGTSLLLSFINAGVYDNAMSNDLITVGTAQISSVIFKYGASSMAFSGSGAWLTAPDRTALQLATGDFTIEGWVYITTAGVAYGVVSKGTAVTGWSVNITTGNLLQFSYTATVLTGGTALSAATWYYFAVVRSGSGTGNLKIYLNGTADATSAGAVTDAFTQTSILYVGADRVGGSPLNGYIDDLRITKGIARYTANFGAPGLSFPNQ